MTTKSLLAALALCALGAQAMAQTKPVTPAPAGAPMAAAVTGTPAGVPLNVAAPGKSLAAQPAKSEHVAPTKKKHHHKKASHKKSTKKHHKARHKKAPAP